jgi:hypothetical protein
VRKRRFVHYDLLGAPAEATFVPGRRRFRVPQRVVELEVLDALLLELRRREVEARILREVVFLEQLVVDLGSDRAGDGRKSPRGRPCGP